MSKKDLIVVSVIIVITIFALGLGESQKDGRYQVVSAKTIMFVAGDEKGPGGGVEMSVCFKIDTATGKTWVYYDITSTGKVLRGWREVPEKPTWIPGRPDSGSD